MPAIITFMAGVAILAVILLFGPAALQALFAWWPNFSSQTDHLSLAVQVTVFTLALFGTILVIGWAGARKAQSAPAPAGRGPAFLWGMGLGFAGVSIALAYAFLAGGITGGEGGGPDSDGLRVAFLVWGCGVVLFQAWAEEYYFRGWLQPVLARAWGQGIAVVATAFAFAALHFITFAESPWSLANLMLGGLLFAMLAAHGGGISAATGAHFAWNAAEQLAFGLDPNPGVGTFGAVIDLDLNGTPLWGGSAEGLNASLPMTMALAVILVPVLILFRGRRAGTTAAA